MRIHKELEVLMHRFVLAVAALVVLASGCASHRLEEHKILYM